MGQWLVGRERLGQRLLGLRRLGQRLVMGQQRMVGQLLWQRMVGWVLWQRMVGQRVLAGLSCASRRRLLHTLNIGRRIDLIWVDRSHIVHMKGRSRIARNMIFMIG